MEATSVWNSLESVKLLISILTPLVIAFIGFLIKKQFRDSELKHEQKRVDEQRRLEEERRRQEDQEKAKSDELTRLYKPHIEFDIDCRFFGPHQGKYAVEFWSYGKQQRCDET